VVVYSWSSCGLGGGLGGVAHRRGLRPIPAGWVVGGSLLGMGDACFGDWGVLGFKSILECIIRCSLFLFLILLFLICHSLSGGQKRRLLCHDRMEDMVNNLTL
jgi:hypothetical protein